MTDKDYMAALGKIRGSRLNDIIAAVNNKVPKKDIKLEDAAEERFFDGLMAQAEAHVKKWGDWPVFDSVEIETDDPRLDIYRDPV